MKKLEGSLQKVISIRSYQKNRMFSLMKDYYSNVKRDVFESDLSEKDFVILLHDESGEIRGFSTIMTFAEAVQGQSVIVVYSGDTIIEKGYRGEFELQGTWLKYVFSIMRRNPSKKLYWFLTSKGYRTYRMLPAFFKKFYPNHVEETPFYEQYLLDTFASKKFGEQYDRKTGVIHYTNERDSLKEDVDDLTEEKLKDPHIRFFTERNPNYTCGDDLACVAEIDKQNFTDIVQLFMPFEDNK